MDVWHVSEPPAQLLQLSQPLQPDVSKICVSCCSYCTRGPSKGRCWQWILLVDAWCIAPQYQWETGFLLVFPATVSNNVISLLHTVRAWYRGLKKHLVVNEYSAVFQTVALNCKPQVLTSIWFVEHGLLGWIIWSARGHWGQHTFNDDLRGSVHKPETDDLMAYVRLSEHLQYLRYYIVRLHTTDAVYVHTLIWKRYWQILKYFSMS